MAWETETGLLDEYEGTIDRAWFATDLQYQDGNVPLIHLEIANIKADDPAAPDTLVEKLSVGNGWEVVDGGKAVEHESGNAKRKFNKRSKYGMLIDAAVKGAGKFTSTDHEYDFTGLLNHLAERGDPKEAKVWEGLRFRFERVEVDYGGEIGTRDFILPVEFVGVEGDGAGSKAESNGDSAADRAKVEAKLKKLAKSADDYDDFVGQALALDGVTDHDDLLQGVTDSSDDGFYALNS